jgi:hypothetical protein
MASKARSLGALFNESALAPCESINAANAIGTKHESWDPVGGIPRSRAIHAASNLGNSVPIRFGADATCRPANLQANGSMLAATYVIVTVAAKSPAFTLMQAQGAAPPIA